MLTQDPANETTSRIIGCAIEVHLHLGPDFSSPRMNRAVEQLAWIHEAQLLTYLRLTGKRLGLVINFTVPVLKHGIRRVINTK